MHMHKNRLNFKLYFILMAGIVTLTGCSGTGSISSPEPEIETLQQTSPQIVSIAQSPNDKRDYRAITLENGLAALLVSDPSTDKSAAALDVNVGSGADPVDREGLAHFLEHMLFLGTEKYPEPGEYQEFINRNGGSHNAFTSFEHTNYFFDVDSDYLEPALDRFSQQFVAPLFSEAYVERERKAVHSEYSAKLRDDGRRFFAVVKQALNPAHPRAKFSVGSLDTLSDRENSKIRDDLLEFYNQHYSAHKMKLVVYGKESLDHLETIVTDKFSAVKNREVVEPKLPPLFNKSQLPSLVSLKPIKEKRTLSLLFELPSAEPHYHKKPLYYLTNLLGHEGEGSLFSWLKEQNYAEALSAGTYISDNDRTIANINISLTRRGRDQFKDVIRDTLTYAKLMLREGIEQWRFKEQAAMLDTAFRFLDKSNPIHYVSNLATRLHDHPASEVIKAPYSMDEYDGNTLQQFASYFTADNLVAVLMAPDADTDQVEKWYQVPYSKRKFTSEELAYLAQYNQSAKLHMPVPNQFIPENLALLAANTNEKPEVLLDEEGFQAWYAKDTSFGNPKASHYVSIRSPLANSTARNLVLTELYVSLAKDALSEYSYPAYLAGLDFKLYKHLRGITIKVDGYSDKQITLMEQILTTLTQLKVDSERFRQNHTDLERDLRNSLKNKPFERLTAEARNWLLAPYWSEQDQIDELATIDQKALEEFIPQFWENLNLVSLNHGNVDREKATKAAHLVKNTLIKESQVIEVDKSRVVDVSPGNWFREIRSEHQDTAYLYYAQAPGKTYYDRALFGLLAQVIGPAYYHSIRTEAQMGYVVFATPYTLLEVPALAFIVQSPSHDANQIHTATEDFLKEFKKVLPEMTEAEFAKHKEAHISRLTEKDKTLEQRSDRYWSEIDIQNSDFNSMQKIADEVSKITKTELATYLEKHILDQPEAMLLVSTPVAKESSSLSEGKGLISGKSKWLKQNELFDTGGPKPNNFNTL